MISKRTKSFRDSYDRLPADIQRRADEAYRQFSADPKHPSLRFKKVHATEPIYSVRISLNYRGVVVVRDDLIVWNPQRTRSAAVDFVRRDASFVF